MNLLINYWAKVGLLFAFTVLIVAFMLRQTLTEIQLLLWIHFATLLLHQYEEYVFPGGFKKFYNKIFKIRLTNSGIIFVNVILAWTAYFFSAFFHDKLLWLTFGLLGITVLNGLLHTVMFLLFRKYNPGLITSILLFIPLGAYIAFKVFKIISNTELVMSLLVFFAGISLVPFSILFTSKLSN